MTSLKWIQLHENCVPVSQLAMFFNEKKNIKEIFLLAPILL